mmetsp:Transcript_525/g.1131  ORF Transcript_525/g.1131 Transcript_525/m.1131 type:complete len:200 (+) Transcript_525:64-663(+)
MNIDDMFPTTLPGWSTGASSHSAEEKAAAAASSGSGSRDPLAELQMLFLPCAVGTFAIIASCVSGIYAVGAVRYADKEFEHPYKPWLDSHNDKEGRHYRGFKASQNCVEWAVYTLPLLWIFGLYAPSLPMVGNFMPWTGGALSLVYAFYNNAYVPAYMASAKDRLLPFTRRTLAFKAIAAGAGAGVLFSVAKGITDLVV